MGEKSKRSYCCERRKGGRDLQGDWGICSTITEGRKKSLDCGTPTFQGGREKNKKKLQGKKDARVREWVLSPPADRIKGEL